MSLLCSELLPDMLVFITKPVFFLVVMFKTDVNLDVSIACVSDALHSLETDTFYQHITGFSIIVFSIHATGYFNSLSIMLFLYCSFSTLKIRGTKYQYLCLK